MKNVIELHERITVTFSPTVSRLIKAEINRRIIEGDNGNEAGRSANLSFDPTRRRILAWLFILAVPAIIRTPGLL